MLLVEATKSMVLSDRVALVDLHPPSNAPASLLDRERDLIDRLRVADRFEQLGQQQSASGLGPQDERTEILVSRVINQAALIRTWGKMERLGGEAAEYAAFRRGRGFDWSALGASARRDGEDAVLLSLFLGFDHVFLFVVKAGWDFPEVVHRPLSTSELDLLRRRFLREIPGDRWGQRNQTWHRTFQALFEEAREWVRGASVVVLSLPGELWSLPLAVVMEKANWFPDESLPGVVVLPSLALVQRLRRAESIDFSSAIVIGNPTLDLAHATEEANVVANTLNVRAILHEEATRDEVLDRLKRASLIHIAAHGRHTSADPLASGIELHDGIVTAREIISMRLRAELVVLSACDSGLLAEISGEELIGLGRAFLQAGARAVVMSLWRVDDSSTAELMRRFYAFYLATSRPAHALSRAMHEMRHRKGYEHPYYWAPFVMMGDWVPAAEKLQVHSTCA